jgi:glutamate---cysteine ligase / carboxylate-amine ligase
MKRPSLTIGVEEEYQIIDPETRELQSYITQILEDERLVLGQVKPELHQSIVEVGTTRSRRPARIRFHTGPTRKSRRSSATSALVRPWASWRSSS